MLWESIQYISTPCEPWAKEIGYLYESIATGARFKRCQKAWATHLQKTRQCILSASNQITPEGRILILGSGWLADIPLEELAGKFREIILVDAVHPTESTKFASRFSNVRLLHCDITGWIESLLLAESKDDISAPPDVPKILFHEGPFELMISANILSQLSVKPMEWLVKKFRFEEAQLDFWKRRLQRAHLNFMETLSRARCLITDTDYRIIDSENTIIERGRLLSDIHLPQSLDSWEWMIIPREESEDGTATIHSVQCSLW